ncbi:hypothetical protein P171DRAFT_469365 [Karstenula rhodostoma CBS 690.94]|uniref:Uncharacterized protein n=1 Tax=Karstenula rhodostoma CBS 690.94 TaxID=1392251 RepID=A0A9P4PU14_9PLEO|nr:hypothetical protein P171DRAFT_469365 [Karstenula rhodostoma CBS 690.94]
MRFHSLPAPSATLALSFFALPLCITAQFIFPPPLNGSISDYTSGKATPTMNFSAGDNMFGGWSTPGSLMSFLVYRCTGSTTAGAKIKPLNSDFNSTVGHLAPDKTWEQMPLYSSIAEMFGNGFDPGRNPIWLHGDFFANNKTTGDLCWFELYTGRDTIAPAEEGGESERVVTVNGDGDWYFATEPFTVHPPRPNNLTVTWKSSGPKPDLFKNHTEAYWADFYSQFPSLERSSSSGPGKESGGYSVILQGPGWIGILALAVALVL